jgi:hypothetical protein
MNSYKFKVVNNITIEVEIIGQTPEDAKEELESLTYQQIVSGFETTVLSSENYIEFIP